MSSIQIGGLVYFTLIAIGAWLFFGVIFLQLKRFMNMSCYVPLVAKVLTVLMIVITLLGYVLVFSPTFIEWASDNTPSARPSGYFDTY